ncbi:MAG: hypothetical protein NVSMB23_12990 [Myxococcales bacterium]
MTCAEFQELAALYALDALEPAERAAADAHLAQAGHAGCEEVLARARAAAEAMARALDPARPDAALWKRIEATLPRGSGAAGPARFREPLAWAVAAAAIVAVFLLQGGRMRDRAEAGERERQIALSRSASESAAESCRRDLSAMRGHLDEQKTALALLQSPSARLVPLAPVAGAPMQGRATALIDPQQKRGIVLSSASQLGTPKAGVYQLWLIRGKAAPIPAGLLAPGSDGLLADIAPALLEPGAPDAVAISLEPGPGPSAAPTTVIALGAYPHT